MAFPLVVRQVEAFARGDFESSRDLSRDLLPSFGRTSSLTEHVEAQALSEVLLGEPEAALHTVAQLEEFDFGFLDGTQVRALAHLALGDTGTAITFVRRLATRAATGVWPAESNDAMIVLAVLAHHHGDDDEARRLLLNAGGGRQPAPVGNAHHLAQQRGIADECKSGVAALYLPDSPHGPMGATRSRNALRSELARRGWN